MTLERSLLLAGGAGALVIWFLLPEKITTEWPISSIVIALLVTNIPARIVTARRDPTAGVPWYSHWAVSVMAIPVVLMMDASMTLGAAGLGRWVFILGGAAFIVWFATRPGVNGEPPAHR